MTHFTAKDFSILIDKSNETITVVLGPHAAFMTIGEWSKIIAMPMVSPRVVLPLHEKET